MSVCLTSRPISLFAPSFSTAKSRNPMVFRSSGEILPARSDGGGEGLGGGIGVGSGDGVRDGDGLGVGVEAGGFDRVPLVAALAFPPCEAACARNPPARMTPGSVE